MCVYVNTFETGIFGNLTYSLIGDSSKNFNIDAVNGVITVVNSTFLDRERLPEASFSAVATDKAPVSTRRSSIVPVIQLFFISLQAEYINEISKLTISTTFFPFYFSGLELILISMYIGLCDHSGCER